MLLAAKLCVSEFCRHRNRSFRKILDNIAKSLETRLILKPHELALYQLNTFFFSSNSHDIEAANTAQTELL